MGKWTDIVKDLPALQEERSYQETVNARKREIVEEMIEVTPHSLATRFKVERERKSGVEDELSAVNLDIAALEQLIRDAYAQAGITSLKLTTGGTVSTQPEPYSSVKDRDQLYDWCIEQKLQRSMALPWQTLNSIVKERLQNGDALPPGVEVFARTQVKLAKK